MFSDSPVYALTGGTVSGLVTDPSGAVLKGAVVTLVGTAQQNTYRTTSNQDGSYTFPNVAVGNYDLTVSFSGLIFPTSPLTPEPHSASTLT
jgi:hypothetical protein